jgi:hypothetical protein
MSTTDFTAIQTDIINYLKNQTQFSDYVFTGSAISVLVDIMAYNASNMAVNANLVFNETMLDTANQRANVVSRAKELGYIPRSKTAATANIRMSFVVSGNPTQYILPANTRFSATINGSTYTFVTTDENIFTNVSNVFTSTITIAQGVLTSYQYIRDITQTQQRFTIPTTNVDLNYLTVSKKNSISDIAFSIVENFNNLTFSDVKATTSVFFLSEMYDGYYDTYFGDNVFGAALNNGNVILLQYLITNADVVNGAQSFTLASTLPTVSALTITTINAAFGGSQNESIESVKFVAPLFHQAQDRAVTETDYAALLKNSLGIINDVSVWGGEKNTPKAYGRVFVAIDPVGNQILSSSEKKLIVDSYLSKYNIVGIIPEILDPNYIFVDVSTTVTYNARLFNRNNNLDLESNVNTAITNFFIQQVNKFGQSLYYSKLLATIDGVSPIIEDNITNLTLTRQVGIIPGIATNYAFNFNNAIEPGSLIASQIVINSVNYFIKDIPTAGTVTGVLAIYKMNGNNVQYLNTTAGTVNYNTGAVLLQNVKIDDIVLDPINKELSMTVSQGNLVDLANQNIVTTDFNVYANGRDDIVVLRNISIALIADNS